MFEFFIARRYLRSKGGRFFSSGALSAIAGIFIGVAAIIIVLSVMNGFHQELKVRILGLTPHIIIAKYSYDNIENYDSLLIAVRNYPGVISAEPFIYTKTIIRKQNTSDGIIVRGIVADAESEIISLKKDIVQGTFDLSDNNVILGIDLARSIGARVGDEISLVAPFAGEATPFGVLPRLKNYTVTAIFDAGMYDYNTSFVYTGLKSLQDFLGIGDAVSGIELKVKNINATDKIVKQIRADLGFPYRVSDWMSMNRNIFTALRLEKVVTFIVLVLIVLVAAFGIIGLLVMMVIRKTKEIGILTAMGAKKKSIVKIFMLTGFMIGLIGTISGTIFGVAVSFILDKYRIINLPGDVYFIKNLPVQVALTDVLLVLLIALAISFFSTIYPAYKAANLIPVEAIRNE
ncbi:MAG: ABC transporter permease [Candidatus Latescibacteria bacterium]|nr:ABC transporter permease [Candidatus Latescibacterota bacterium]